MILAVSLLKLQHSQNGSLNFWGQIMSTLTCTWTCEQHLVRQNPHRGGQLTHCCTVFRPDIGNQYSLINNAGFSNFTHTPAAVKTMPVAKKWSFCVSGKLSKTFWVWQRSVTESIFEPYLNSRQCFLLLTVSLQRFFNSLFCVQSLCCSLCIVSLYKPSTAATQGCIHQSTQGTTANWFPNRISLLPAIRLHYDFLKSLIN